MKKFFKFGCLGVVGIVVLVIIIAMFSGGDDSTNTGTDAGTKDKAKTEKASKIGEEVAVDNLAFTVNESTTATKLSAEYMDDITTKGKFVIVDVTVKNNDKDSRILDSEMFRLIGTDGTEFSTSVDADSYLNKDLGFFLQEVNPKMDYTGKVAFEVPAEEEGYKLQVSSGIGWSGGEYKTIELK